MQYCRRCLFFLNYFSSRRLLWHVLLVLVVSLYIKIKCYACFESHPAPPRRFWVKLWSDAAPLTIFLLLCWLYPHCFEPTYCTHKCCWNASSDIIYFGFCWCCYPPQCYVPAGCFVLLRIYRLFFFPSLVISVVLHGASPMHKPLLPTMSTILEYSSFITKLVVWAVGE